MSAIHAEHHAGQSRAQPGSPNCLRSFRRIIVGALAAMAIGGCGSGGDQASIAQQSLSPLAALGEQIFKDRSLSASGQQACASCHVEAAGHAQDNALPAQLGGAALDRQGRRVSPSIRYLASNRAFAFDDEGTPVGGFFLDGRARTLAEQAAEPFVNPDEMALASPAELIARIARAPYADAFRASFGEDIFSRPGDAYQRVGLALQAYQLEDSDFAPFTSKYDAFIRGATMLEPAELRGLSLFNDPNKGNCAACHPSAPQENGGPALFTDFSFDNLGVPRNPAIARNADPDYFDLGLCANGNPALAARTDLCGAFKVPSLRNVALRRAFFHNGRFTTLKDALRFYVQRDTNPERFYPLAADGSVRKFDDLPVSMQANVNTSEAPYNRGPGQAPALSDAEIDELIAFLNTLTDGWQP